MNTESFGYAVLSALVGMAIVFIFLVVLSAIMVVLRRVFDAPARNESSSRGEAAAVDLMRETPSSAGDPPQWVIAGVMAYLSSEEQNSAPHAGVWTKWGRQ